jgi:Zn-dependent peptidase ImmA (M78 family)/DNA-binding XRE family transcriptional regulator
MAQPKNLAFVKPELLVWAREDAGYSVDEAAKKISVKPEKLAACEAGDDRLTVNQLRNLSNAYKRPFAFFYLPTPPRTEISLQDFRHFTDEDEHRLKPLLRVEIRKAKGRREIALNMLEELDQEPEVFVSFASADESVQVIGQRIRELLDVSFERQVRLRSDYEALRFWRNSIEARGVLTFQASVPKSEMRGFSMWFSPLPIIVVNAKDSPYGRVFTMLHELAHVMLRSGGLCDLGEDKIEVFCNAVAGETLVPSEMLLQEKLVRDNEHEHAWTDETLIILAGRYGVSREVILRRLLTLDRTTQEFYRQKRTEWMQVFESSRDKESTSSGFAPPPVKALSAVGPTFAGLVLDCYNQERISPVDAAQYLGVKIKHLSTIENAIKIPSLTSEAA